MKRSEAWLAPAPQRGTPTGVTGLRMLGCCASGQTPDTIDIIV